MKKMVEDVLNYLTVSQPLDTLFNTKEIEILTDSQHKICI